ncbi:ABC transporter, ATP-binding protein, partial [Ostertagia ostertagi]
MCDCLRQLWLLTRKNLILTRRSKVWTLFEVVLPILFTLPIIILIVRGGTVQLSPGRSFDAVPLEGGAGDINRTVGFVAAIRTRWCNRPRVSIAYCARESEVPVDNLMNKLAKRFSSPILTVDVVKMKDEEYMLEQLRADAPNSTQYGCAINKFAGGVVFKQFDTTAGKLDYTILIPTEFLDDPWHLDQLWDDPFGANNDYNRIPGKPPYWSSAFLSVQYAIDSLFIEASSPNVTLVPELRLRRMPEATYNLNSVAAFLGVSSYFWGLCVFVLVIHTAREIASERSTVKPVSASLFFVTLILYGVSAVVFAALVSSLFKTPNTALKVVIVLWVILVAAPFRAPRVDQILYCTLYSLNPNAAFSYALKTFADYMNRGKFPGRELSWSNSFEDGSFHFTAGAALVMLLVDIIWMSAATLFFDFMFSDSDFTFFKLPFGNSYLSSSAPRLEQDDGNNETDEGLLRTRAGISVQRLIKVWTSTGERAVDDMSLEAYVGQVTVLLGHNGAGKSTTFSVISGITAPSAGTVSIYDLDIQKQRSACRKRIGLCPQANALFDRLTVDEHLWFIHGLKGASGSYKVEGQQLLDQLKLDEKSDELAMNLSGGQKRKLCVSMAVIGGSAVVLLDEPTAGMDPGARRDVEALLETVKVDRTVLLTTHYMDEAELLGDRVAIMAKGRVYCCGTPQFLKKRFGTGYVMTVVVAEKANASDVAGTVTRIAGKYVLGAERGNVHGKQFEIILPKEHQE